MPYDSDRRFLALHGLRLKAVAEAPAVADAMGIEPSVVAGELASLAEEGLVVRREGRVAGWSLTPDGRAAHTRLAAGDLERSGRRDEVTDAYRAFLKVNAPLLEACTAWQLRTVEGRQLANDHADPAHDRAVVARVRAIHDEMRPVWEQLGSLMSRFGGYGRRLGAALTRVEEGEPDWLTRPMIDSYHTVWFEWHEDFLVTLGIERSQEHA